MLLPHINFVIHVLIVQSNVSRTCNLYAAKITKALMVSKYIIFQFLCILHSLTHILPFKHFFAALRSLSRMLWVSIMLLAVTLKLTKGETVTLGYLTGSQRLPGDLEYARPGLTISGAISLAVEEVNAGLLSEKGHRLDFIVAETYGDERLSVKETADLWTRNVSAYIGPQETCEHEAYMAAAFNLPMISYVSTHD